MGFRDIRYAVRSLVHDAGVSTVVILCLSLGIGVNATLFGLVDGILIQPLPYVEPERLFILNQSFERGGIRDAGVSYQDLRDLEERSTMFAQMAGLGGRTIALSDQGEAERFQPGDESVQRGGVLDGAGQCGVHAGANGKAFEACDQ